MDMKQITTWVEAHPGESIVIGGGGLLLLLWLLGFFSSSTQAAPSQDPLAAAYYAAEAQQAVVGGQIQMNNADTAAATAQAGINANAATTIAATNAGAATTINGQNVGAAQTINQAQVTGATTIAATQAGVFTTLGSDQLQATAINTNAALAGLQNNNATFLSANQANIYGQESLAALNNVIPGELMLSGTSQINLPGIGQISALPITEPDPNAWMALGFSAEQANQIALGQMGNPPGVSGFPPEGFANLGAVPINMAGG